MLENKASFLFGKTGAAPAKWLLCAVLSVAAAGATYWPHAIEALGYDRNGILSGEIWRLATAHFVHLNTPHLMMNLLALFLLCELVWRSMDVWRGIGLLTFSAFGVGMLLLALHSELAWYVGLSGALHGLWAGCALNEIWPARTAQETGANPRRQWSTAVILPCAALALLCVKLVLEFHYGPSQRTVQAIGGQVIAVSHAYGAFGGVAYMLFWHVIKLVKDVPLPFFRLK